MLLVGTSLGSFAHPTVVGFIVISNCLALIAPWVRLGVYTRRNGFAPYMLLVGTWWQAELLSR